MRLLIVIVSCFIIYKTKTQPFTNDDVDFVNLVHRSFCGPKSLCTSMTTSVHGSTGNFTRMLDDLPLSVPETPRKLCCKECSCSRKTCVDSGTCCPDILEHFPTVEESSRPTPATCRTTSLRDINNYIGYYLVYHFCAKGFKTGDTQNTFLIKSKCENAERYHDLDTKQPVIDLASRRMFLNMFCGVCNFVKDSDLIPMIPRLSCYHGETFLKNVNITSLVQDVLNTTNCDLEFEWPMNQVDFPPPVCKNVVTECNVTGHWKQYDHLIEAACHAYRAEYAREYKNVFCLLCNENGTSDTCGYNSDAEFGGGGGYGKLSFSVVLNFNRDTSHTAYPRDVSDRCSDTQVYDHYKGICRNLSCIFPRSLQDGECVIVAVSVREVAYKLQLKFKPLEVYREGNITQIVSMIADYTLNLMVSWDSFYAAVNYDIFYQVAQARTNDSDFESVTSTTNTMKRITSTRKYYSSKTTMEDTFNINTNTLSTSVTGGFTSQSPKQEQEELSVQSTESTSTKTSSDAIVKPSLENITETDQNEQDTVSTVEYVMWQVEWFFKLHISASHSANFVDNILDLDKTNVTLNTSTNGKSIIFTLFIADCESDGNNIPKDPVQNTTLSRSNYSANLPNAEYLKPVLSPIRSMKSTLVCPLIKIDSDEFNIIETLTGIFVVELNASFDKTTYNKEAIAKVKVNYFICKDKYISLTDTYDNKQLTYNAVTPKGVVSLVCACISILCLFLTFVTYVLFSELRTQPGINNMCLCIYLIFAEALFTFATPLGDSVPELLCSFLGVVVHFFWLMVMFAMNVCCFHMFMVFIGHSTSRPQSSSKFMKSVIYTVYCVLTSMLFVTINVVVVVVDTDKEKSGYGDGICYISRPEMVGYTFALPLGFVVLTNLIFFAAVVFKISRSPTVPSSMNHRNYFKIYAKLSTVTGLTWIFGFLFQFTKQEVFEYAFIIFNGGIGVLIFMSFVCNKRISNLYKDKLSKTSSRTGTSSRSSPKSTETHFSALSENTD